MKNYKMIIAYEGRRYKGYRKTKGDEDKTVQGKIERILYKLYSTEVELISAVNTAPGVNAKHQVCNFTTPTDQFSKEEIYDYIETYLPDDIIVLEIEEVEERFHSRYNVKGLTYEYHLWKKDSKHRPLIERHFVKKMDEVLDVAAMKEAAYILKGEHDFRAFATKAKVKSTTKRVSSLSIDETENELIISITANSFLLNMERILVGTLVQIGLHDKEVETIDKAFSSLNEKYVGHKAMAEALTLVDVDYGV